MLLDLLSTSNQGNFNIKVAQLFDLETAVYLAEVIAINEKALRKGKVQKVKGLDYFTVDRDYITSRTTLTKAKQKKIEKNLNTTCIIKISSNSEDEIYLDINALCVLLGGEIDNSVISTIKSSVKKNDSEAKFNSIKSDRLRHVKTTIVSLREAYSKWIEAGLNRYGAKKFSNVVVEHCEKEVENFAKGDINVALAVIEGNYNGYTTMQFSIDNYIANHPTITSSYDANKATVLSGEVF